MLLMLMHLSNYLINPYRNLKLSIISLYSEANVSKCSGVYMIGSFRADFEDDVLLVWIVL